jgi:pyoverdine/dityrosine biosynthesis protein Dit1
MEVSNEGHSFYHRFHDSLLAGCNGELVRCGGSRRQWLQENWASLRSTTPTLADTAQSNRAAVRANNDLRNPKETFEDFFVKLILDRADLGASSPQQSRGEQPRMTEQITDLFDSYLRYQGKDDRWAHEGRTHFTERVRHFTARNAPIEFCLPAFPCKSSNRDKVTGPDPDTGEELGLERLHGFVEAVERIYEAGAKVWVISDGHVFSDCIGVDDSEVDMYGEKLKAMNHTIGSRRGNAGRVGFKSLVDLFQLAAVERDGHYPSRLVGPAHHLELPEIDHHVGTNVTDEAELCRRILMAGCGPQKSAVRARIDSKDRAITALYRGFSRFMLEDLEHHPHTRDMTRSQQKKLSAKVAFEMILVSSRPRPSHALCHGCVCAERRQRNQAYSNLIEMLFPNHVRLSIHS